MMEKFERGVEDSTWHVDVPGGTGRGDEDYTGGLMRDYGEGEDDAHRGKFYGGMQG